MDEISHLFSFKNDKKTYETIRFDKPTHPYLMKSLEKMLGYYWQPQEISLIKDKLDFSLCTEDEKRVFIRNLQRQTFLDSIQSTHICNSIVDIVTNNELSIILTWWSSFESLHSLSYSYILQAIFDDPSPILDEIEHIEFFKKDVKNFDKYFSNAKNSFDDLYLALICSHILEGLQFMSSFAMTFAFVEHKRVMNGNANILKLILRDENLHLSINNYLINHISHLVKEETKQQAIELYKQAIQREKEWVNYLFGDKEIIGLNAKSLNKFIDYMGQSRMKNISLTPFSNVKNPFPWFSSYAFSDTTQVAPQELELTAYTTSYISLDDDESMNFEL